MTIDPQLVLEIRKCLFQLRFAIGTFGQDLKLVIDSFQDDVVTSALRLLQDNVSSHPLIPSLRPCVRTLQTSIDAVDPERTVDQTFPSESCEDGSDRTDMDEAESGAVKNISPVKVRIDHLRCRIKKLDVLMLRMLVLLYIFPPVYSRQGAETKQSFTKRNPMRRNHCRNVRKFVSRQSSRMPP